jgi:NADPH-dependent ferric siderophore reductase
VKNLVYHWFFMSTSERPTDTKSLLARLDGAAAYTLTLTDRWDVSPSLIGMRLEGDLSTLHPLPGNDLMFGIPDAGGDGTFRRRYTIRSINHEADSLELWVDRISGGPGALWAEKTPLGSLVEAIGPRGQVVLDPMADWHLFVGDLSFISAAYAMAEAIDPPGQALFVLEIPDPADAVLPELDDHIGVTVCFVERSERSLDDPSGLIRSLDVLEFPRDDGHVYVGGELHVVAALKHYFGERAIPGDALHTKPYWRLGVSNLPHGEPKKD